MSNNTPNPAPFDQDDIWSLENTLPLDQVIALARDRAAQGDVAAQAFMTLFAQAGERQSFRQQAAEGGNRISMLELAGQFLASGDYAQALMWFERAAAQGSAEAHVRLGIMIAKGQGVTPDPVAAIARICTARQSLEKDTYIELVLDEQDYPFDLGDPDVYYPHVIERIFGDYSRQDKQRVYDYLHELGIQAESDDEAETSAPITAEVPALDYAPKWLTQFLRGLASQSESASHQARLLTAVLEGVQLLNTQTDSLEVAWFDALLQPETFLAQLAERFPDAPDQLKVLFEENADTLEDTIDAVWPSLRHAYRRIQQQQSERESAAKVEVTVKTQHSVTPVKVDVVAQAAPEQIVADQTGPHRFGPYQYNVTPMRCGNRACTWVGSMAQTDHQRCPLCQSDKLFRNDGAKLLNGSLYAKQRDSLLNKHASALRTLAWFMYATTDDYQDLASEWGNATYAWIKTR
jgi:hypothetical protein